jgi:hypothetical protein
VADIMRALPEQQIETSHQAGQPAYRSPTLRESLLSQKADLTQRMANVDAAISALDNNPNFEEIINIIQKV